MAAPPGEGPIPKRRSLFRRLLNDAEPPAEPTPNEDDADLIRRRRVGSVAPPIPDAAQRLREHVQRLAQAGALDEGSGAVFDVLIASWVQQWHNEVDEEYDARQSQLQLREARAAAEVTRRRLYVDWASRQLEEIDARIAELGGPEPPPHQANGRHRPGPLNGAENPQ